MRVILFFTLISMSFLGCGEPPKGAVPKGNSETTVPKTLSEKSVTPGEKVSDPEKLALNELVGRAMQSDILNSMSGIATFLREDLKPIYEKIKSQCVIQLPKATEKIVTKKNGKTRRPLDNAVLTTSEISGINCPLSSTFSANEGKQIFSAGGESFASSDGFKSEIQSRRKTIDADLLARILIKADHLSSVVQKKIAKDGDLTRIYSVSRGVRTLYLADGSEVKINFEEARLEFRNHLEALSKEIRGEYRTLLNNKEINWRLETKVSGEDIGSLVFINGHRISSNEAPSLFEAATFLGLQ